MDRRTPEHPEPDEESIQALELAVRSRRVLYRAGIRTVRQLRELSDAQILAIRGAGPNLLAEVRSRVGAGPPDPASPPGKSVSSILERTEQRALLELGDNLGRIQIDRLGLPPPTFSILRNAEIR